MFSARRKRAFTGRKQQTGILDHRLLLAGGILALVAFLLLGQFGESGVAAWWKLRTEQTRLRQEVAELEASNQLLKTRLESLTEGHQALEKIAREKYDMRRPDEEVLLVIDRTDGPEKPAVPATR